MKKAGSVEEIRYSGSFSVMFQKSSEFLFSRSVCNVRLHVIGRSLSITLHFCDEESDSEN